MYLCVTGTARYCHKKAIVDRAIYFNAAFLAQSAGLSGIACLYCSIQISKKKNENPEMLTATIINLLTL